MIDRYAREKELAKQLVEKSCKIKPNEKVLITYSDTPTSFVERLVEIIAEKKATPFVYRLDKILKRKLLLTSNNNSINAYKKIVEPIMKDMDAVILIAGSFNDYELSDIPTDILNLYQKNYVEPIHFKIRCSKKWVLLRYPTPTFAHSCQMSS